MRRKAKARASELGMGGVPCESPRAPKLNSLPTPTRRGQGRDPSTCLLAGFRLIVAWRQTILSYYPNGTQFRCGNALRFWDSMFLVLLASLLEAMRPGPGASSSFLSLPTSITSCHFENPMKSRTRIKHWQPGPATKPRITKTPAPAKDLRGELT